MKSEDFLKEVVAPNILTIIHHIDDYRAAVNSILTLDAYFGIRFVELKSASHPFVAGFDRDDAYRDELSKRSGAYRVLRDAAAALKHGELEGRKARLLKSSDSVVSRSVSLHGTISAVVIEFEEDDIQRRLTAEFLLSKGLTVARQVLVNPDYKDLFPRRWS
ncbi:hypothetical protein [Tardiphaga sp. 813_E8_N1_3]|uniref:hypothetical protein n=1 Tax=Tardiphaga sp. 813_E8_N1_3 TaxID=3240760 RepID=UPI003F254665